MDWTNYKNKIMEHYQNNWSSKFNVLDWEKGQRSGVYGEFRVIEIPPFDQRNMWTYATCCMSSCEDKLPIELHIFSKVKNIALVELLTAIAYYHINDNKLGHGHTINFGKQIEDHSKCTHGLISLPYLDGPKLEILKYEECTIRFLWLIPITQQELIIKKEKGLEALENLFQNNNFNYLNFKRNSIV